MCAIERLGMGGLAQSVLANLLEGCHVLGPDYRYIYANEVAARHLRTTPQNLIGRAIAEAFPGIEDSEVLLTLRHCMDARASRRVRHEFTCPDGSRAQLELRCEPAGDGVAVFSTEITERTRSEIAMPVPQELAPVGDSSMGELGRTEGQLDAIVRASPAAIISVDMSGRVLSWNAGAERLFGWTREEAIGQLLPTVPESGRPEYEVLVRQLLAGESTDELQVERVRRDGTSVWVSLSTAPLRDKKGNVTGMMALATDISQRRHAERERETSLAFLQIVNEGSSTRELVEKAVRFFRDEFGFEAVGIRLKEGEDYPYYEASGFPTEFIKRENSLCSRDEAGAVRRGANCDPILECMCGNVIEGRVDLAKPFFTARGSFWSNHTTRMLSTTTPQDGWGSTRNRCNGQGYESVGLFPLRSGDRCLGLLQLNDRRTGRFSAESLALYERFAGYLAVAIAKARADEELARSESRYRRLVANLQDVVFSADLDGNLEYISPAVERAYGFAPAELVGKPLLEFVHPADRSGVAAAFAHTLTGEVEPYEFRAVDKRGRTRRLRSTARLRTDDGMPSGIDGLFVDWTDLYQARRAEKQSEERYRSLFLNATVGVAHCRMICVDGHPDDLVYLDVNPAFETLTGLRGVVGRLATEVLPGIRQSDGRLFELCGRTAHDGVSQRFDIYANALGQWLDLSLYSTEQEHFVAVFDVITERKRTEERMVKFSQRLQCLARVVQELSQVRSFEAIVHFVPRAARELVGAEGASLVLREGDLCHHVEEDSIAPLWKGRRFPISSCVGGLAIVHRQALVIEDVYADERTSNQGYEGTFVRSLTMMPIRTQDPIGAIGTFWANPHRATSEDLHLLQALADSTAVAMENVRVLGELEEGKARIRAIYDHLPNPAFVWKRRDSGFELSDFNEPAHAVTHGRVVELVGHAPAQLESGIPHLDADLQKCFQSRSAVRREVDCNFPGSTKLGRFVLTYGYIPSDMVILHTEDVTEQRHAEEQLRLSQRLEAVGRLAGGVAHDFNNLLSVIISYADFALESLRDPDPVREDIREIQKAGRRAETLTRQLLAFSRKQVLEPVVLNLNKIILDVENMLRRVLGEDIEIVLRLTEQLGSVTADPGQLEQVIMNLAVNARDAMPQGGKLTIETTNVELDGLYAGQHAGARPGGYVLLSVNDSGGGIEPSVREHIFEPFFTTKEKGKGSGLGLATVYGIVKQSGGNICVYSEIGHGTTFKVYLPRVDRPATETRRRTLRAPAAGSETVLIVEDEDAVRRLAERILRGVGYDVVSAISGGDALLLCEKRVGPIDLLLTDVIMPHMSGRDLAQRLTKMRPGLRVVYMSGYTDDAIVDHGLLDPGTHFIGKPFSAADLAKKIREVLDEGKAKLP